MNILDLAAGLIGVLVFWFCIPYLLKRWQIAKLRRHCRISRTIVLTYDDGPGEILTPALLKVLADNKVHANFFMVGHKVQLHLNQVQHVASSGHAIGSHSFRHLHAWKNNPLKIAKDIQAGFQTCQRIATSNWFRPPFGKITLATMLQTWITRHRFAWWTVDSSDTWRNPLSIEKVVENVKRKGGGVILMHDYDRQNLCMNDYVISLTLCLIQLARDEGYNICTLQDLPK